MGLNKQETAEKFGKEQVKIWRRSYDTPPPGGESLKNVVDRVAPYFRKNIKPLLDQNKNILIVAHGNSLRAMMIELGMYKHEEISSIVKICNKENAPIVCFGSGTSLEGNALGNKDGIHLSL